jgi:hypothetical protein
LRDLPDTPVRLPEIPYIEPADIHPEFPEWTSKDAKGGSKVAGLDVKPTAPEPEDVTGSINAAAGGTLSIDIGEESSTELPVLPAEERPPVIGLRERVDAPSGIGTTSERQPPTIKRSRARPAASTHAQPEPKLEAPIPFNLLQALFDSLLSHPPAQAKKTARAPAAHIQQPARPQATRTVRSVSK